MKLPAFMPWIAPAVFIGVFSSAHASTLYDFTSGGTPYTPVGTSYGNALDFGDMTATGWGTTGVPHNYNSLLDTAQIWQWPTGLGVCNRSEGTVGGGCSVFSEHQVDNVGDDDYVLFAFDQAVQFDQIIIDPYFTTDRDVSYWIGNVASFDLTGLDPVALDPPGTTAFGDPINVSFGFGNDPVSVNLGGASGNALLFAARADPGNWHDNDYFKIASLEVTATVIPVPAAVWLFGSGLIGLIGVMRRRKV